MRGDRLFLLLFIVVSITFVSAIECGDGICEGGEDASCPEDCEAQVPVFEVVCGDAICDVEEDNDSCPEDCAITHKPRDAGKDNGVVDTEDTLEVDKGFFLSSTMIMIIVGVLIVIVIGVIAFLFFKVFKKDEVITNRPHEVEKDNGVVEQTNTEQ